MAINIQEILHPSDSDAIKFEKINYNFDQIVANGGGPTGQKGGQGAQGTKGNTGFKGQKGEQGIQGLTGATTSPWQVINVNPNSNTETYSILKPKLTTDNLHPTIFLGDQTFNENTPADGDILQRATLTIGKHAVGQTVGSDYLLTLWHGADNSGNNVSITLESENRTDGSVRYKFGNSFNVSGSSTVEYYTAFDKFTVGDDTAFRVPVNSAAGTVAGTAEAGLIRYNPSTNVFQGGVLVGSSVYWTDFCMAPCGQGGGSYSINIEPDGDVFVNQYGTPYTGGTANSIEFNPTDSYDLDNDGQTWTGPATTSTTSTTTTTTAPSYTLTFPNGDNTVSVPAGGGTYTIEYETGPIADKILTTQPTVGTATWINVTNYNATSPETVTFSIPAQGYGTSQRSGSIYLTHPDSTSTTAIISVTQAGIAATTQAPATTTQAPATTQAPLPTFTASNINLQVANGTEGQAISYTWGNTGTLVSVNPTVYSEGSATYTATVTVPSGYSNAGATVTDTDTATGAEVYKINFDANTSSATGSMSPQTGTGPNPVTIPYAPGYSVSGFTFSGWNTASDGSGVSHSGGSSPYYQAYISGTSGIYDTLDLYAQWTENVTTTTTEAEDCIYYTAQSNATASSVCNIVAYWPCGAASATTSSPVGAGTTCGGSGYGNYSITFCHSVTRAAADSNYPGDEPYWNAGGNGSGDSISVSGLCTP